MQSYVNTNNVDYKDTLPMMCSMAGASIMTPKNSDLSSKWNVGFQKARTHGMLAALCSKALVIYGKTSVKTFFKYCNASGAFLRNQFVRGAGRSVIVVIHFATSISLQTTRNSRSASE